MGRLIVEPRGGGGDVDATTAELLALVDRLEELLQRSSLQELEVEAGETTIMLRTPAAVAPQVDERSLAALLAGRGSAVAGDGGAAGGAGSEAVGNAAGGTGPVAVGADAAAAAAELQERHAVLAPLTGIYYGSPTPEAAAYVRVGTHVQEGQVIGLIEAMKLFNEIKSDATGTVTRIVAESGTLVKAKSPLIELERA